MGRTARQIEWPATQTSPTRPRRKCSGAGHPWPHHVRSSGNGESTRRGNHAVPLACGVRCFTPVQANRSVLSSFFCPRAAKNLPAPDRPLPPHRHLPSLASTDIPTFTRTEHPVHRDINRNAGGRETEVTCYGITLPSPITPPKTPHATI